MRGGPQISPVLRKHTMQLPTGSMFTFTFALTAVLIASPRLSSAQCENAAVAGVNGSVTAVTAWDPDGEGPVTEILVVGGRFSIAGDVAASNVAAWDGARWSALGPGFDNRVDALRVYRGELIAAGSF